MTCSSIHPSIPQAIPQAISQVGVGSTSECGYALNARGAEFGIGWPAGQRRECSATDGPNRRTFRQSAAGGRLRSWPVFGNSSSAFQNQAFCSARQARCANSTPGDAGFGTLSGALSSDWAVTRAFSSDVGLGLNLGHCSKDTVGQSNRFEDTARGWWWILSCETERRSSRSMVRMPKLEERTAAGIIQKSWHWMPPPPLAKTWECQDLRLNERTRIGAQTG